MARDTREGRQAARGKNRARGWMLRWEELGTWMDAQMGRIGHVDVDACSDAALGGFEGGHASIMAAAAVNAGVA